MLLVSKVNTYICPSSKCADDLSLILPFSFVILETVKIRLLVVIRGLLVVVNSPPVKPF